MLDDDKVLAWESFALAEFSPARLSPVSSLPAELLSVSLWPASLLLAVLIAFSGCGALPPGPGWTDASGRPVSGVWILRHKVRLDIPRADIAQSFDGLMRLDFDRRSAHIVGLGGPGIRLFDLTLNENGVQPAYLHPILEKLPKAMDKIAECIYDIWFDTLPQLPQNVFVRRDGRHIAFSGPLCAGLWPERIIYTDTRIPYTVTIRLLQAAKETP
ncbi:MAG: hypothetical protein LBQ51_08975 [Desulfovibrio sp.]|jgi:hypothetical protein|nr:hypothetical protein [Desulfovibrio sp.]